MFELHWNKVPEASRSGMMVFFSQLKMAEDGLQGEALAARVLKTLKKNNGVGNYYTVMNDKYSRFGGLGIVSRTKPNSVLIEYGFLSNAKDLEFSKKNPGRIAKDIADAFIGFVGDEEKKVAKK